MTLNKTEGRGLATSAQLALVAFLSIGLATTTHDTVANTLSSVKMKVRVAAPSREDLAAAEKVYQLDKTMNALTPRQAALYRGVFIAQEQGDFKKADKLIADITDARLMGHVLADRYERQPASGKELTQWLNEYATLPEAAQIFAKARKAGVDKPPMPQAPEAWGTGADIDSAANFTPELLVKSTAPNTASNKIAMAVQSALRKGDPFAARDILIKAQANKQLTGTFAYDLEAVIAASFFTTGEREQATILANAAAHTNQPLGLWISGLIAWEKKDDEASYKMFSQLAAHPAMTETNKASANFWAYRAAKREGESKIALKHLIASAAVPRSFYGLLAAQLLDRDPVASLAKNESVPAWNKDRREILVENQAGWRALALLQVGQEARAETELRRLNPQGDPEKKQAMLALAHKAALPGLVLRLASLSQESKFDSSFYPLLPWQPKDGFQVDRALLFALARHESLFDPEAVSYNGARGLLQLMPSTAKAVVEMQEDQAVPPAQANLFDPGYNMAVGQKYVQHLASLPQIGQNLLFLLAAYNAGPSKASKWIEGKDASDPLLFLESIPVRETRNYVARVLPHYWAYRARLGLPVQSLEQMAQGRWPSFSLKDENSVHVASAGSIR